MKGSWKKLSLIVIGIATLWLAPLDMPLYAAEEGALDGGSYAMNCYCMVSDGECTCLAFAEITHTSFNTDYFGHIVLTANYRYVEDQSCSGDGCSAIGRFILIVPGQPDVKEEPGSSATGTLKSGQIYVQSGSVDYDIIVSCATDDGCQAQQSSRKMVTITRPKARTTTSIDPMGIYYPHALGETGATISGDVENDETGQPAVGLVHITVYDPLGFYTSANDTDLSDGFSWYYSFPSTDPVYRYGTYYVMVEFTPVNAEVQWESGASEDFMVSPALNIPALPHFNPPNDAASIPVEFPSIDPPSIGFSTPTILYTIDFETFEINPLFELPGDLASGLCLQSPIRGRDDWFFWTADRQLDMIYQLDSTGTVVIDLPSPGPDPTGLVWQDGFLWNADAEIDSIFLLEPPSELPIWGFPSPGPAPYGLAWNSIYLWCVDSELDSIFKLDPSTGDKLWAFPSPGPNPTGLTWDGEVLWNTDTSESMIYQIDVEPPTAEFRADTTSGTLALRVKFFDESTGGITAWHWEFGDGDWSEERSPSHIYAEAGTYDVSLSVIGAGGADIEQKWSYIEVTPAINLNVVGSFQTAVGDSAN